MDDVGENFNRISACQGCAYHLSWAAMTVQGAVGVEADVRATEVNAGSRGELQPDGMQNVFSSSTGTNSLTFTSSLTDDTVKPVEPSASAGPVATRTAVAIWEPCL